MKSNFQHVLFTAICFTFLAGGASLWLSSKEDLSPERTRVFETCDTTWKMGIGAIFGLLGSQTAALLESDREDDDDDQKDDDDRKDNRNTGRRKRVSSAHR
ncbi:MAG: hypothetical protein HY785_03935 [Oscillatoriophycideae cyanobacterium NC_groundwater_1537_Pr4_S-0.65um_50_18]|jgi:hypothetical protein|nr:hypothetical protein [Oscillatoriophycideae cyanobacterium NC_groundwater_1537_Pr4_S-0.65um_50_18]